MPSTAVAVVDDRPARDRARRCDSCGRRGTFARITRKTASPETLCYCRRCWPTAHRDALQRRKHDVIAWFRSQHASAIEAMAARRPMSEVPPPESVAVAWHWSLIPGTLWRSFRYRLRRADLSALDG